MKIFFLTIIFGFFPLVAHAMVDLSITQEDIRFSEESFISGDIVRIYSTVHNLGVEDVSGYVSFYQGTTLIDRSLVISLPAGGSPEEVYIDFVVPSGSFNILAKIQGTDPEDENTLNNSALTQTFTPVHDDDRDGVVNEDDNCPALGNASQEDNDADGEGDLCDEDDDNDGLTDEVEEELATDTTQSDTDGDLTQDANDAFPADSERAVVAEETSPQAQEAFRQIVEEVARSIEETVEITQEVVEEQNTEPAEVFISPNAVFSYTQDDWNTFSFHVIGNVEGSAVYIWDFGDGVTSSKSSVQHVFTNSGAFPVTLTVTDQNGVISEEMTTILVPFLHLQNRLVLASLIILSLLLLVLCISFMRLGKKHEE